MTGIDLEQEIGPARRAALHVLLNNARTGRGGLPRTAAWGYPEPYTRDLMIGSLGVMASGNEELALSLKQTLLTLAENQTRLGAIPGICDEAEDLGASDTTPLFLIGLAAYRQIARAPGFLEEAAQKALKWCEYQSPADRVLVAQQPTSDWRDELDVPGYGLFVNTLLHTALVLLTSGSRASTLREEINMPVLTEDSPRHAREGLVLRDAPYYALFSYKHTHGSQFDLLGNSIAILSGIASPEKANEIVDWLEARCAEAKRLGKLESDSPPNFLPSIERTDPGWRERYEHFNRPGEYHNGGIWPFVCGFYVAALVAAGRQTLAEEKLVALTKLCTSSKSGALEFGFNEWIRADDGRACGEDWQSWSASMYLYAAICVESGRTPLFDSVRSQAQGP